MKNDCMATMTVRELRAAAYDAVDKAPESELRIQFDFELTPTTTDALVREALAPFVTAGWEVEWNIGHVSGRVWLTGWRDRR